MADREPWVSFNPATYTYDTKDGTAVPAEIVEGANCLADILRIARIREQQRAAATLATGRMEAPSND